MEYNNQQLNVQETDWMYIKGNCGWIQAPEQSKNI